MTVPVKITVHNTILHEIDERLFGQFMEKHAVETGPEFGMQKKGRRLQTDVVEKLKQMQTKLVRFPGGATLESGGTMNLTDMIDNVPDRPDYQGRTELAEGIANRFGFDEFFSLCEQLGTEALLVVNMSNALLKKKPLVEAARDAASLVAYVNSRQIARLPEEMPDWPAIRATNGHPRPYNVPLFQLGDELWVFVDELRKSGMDDAAIADWYIECYRTFIAAMRDIDSSVAIVIDGQLEQNAGLEGMTSRIRLELGDTVDYLAYHRFSPQEMSDVTDSHGNAVDPAKLPPEDLWHAWTAATDFDPATGLSTIASDPAVLAADRNGYLLAVTAWNWNGWWSEKLIEQHHEKPLFSSMLAKGIGAAGFFNAFMRRGNLIKIACQSIMVGHVRDNASVLICQETEQGKKTSRFSPTGLVAMLYSRNHGDSFLQITTEGITTKPQPYRIGTIAAHPTVALLDVCAGRTKNRVYLHLINRSINTNIPVEIDLNDIPGRPGVLANWHIVNGSFPDTDGTVAMANEKVRVDEKRIATTVPAHSVSCIVVDMHQRDQ